MTRKVITKVHSFTGIYAKPIVWALMFIIVMSLFIYIYGINRTVRNVVEHEAIQGNLTTLRSELGELEFKHIGLQNEIDTNMAANLGFYFVPNTTFVSRKSSVALLGLGGDRQ